jgi:hypothetical protein
MESEEEALMRKAQMLAILFFSGIWGLSEAFLGESLYAAKTPFAAVYLTVIALFVLAVAAPFVPRPGGATAMGLLAMLYKVFNVPFFGCHLTAIALLGVSWDLVFGAAMRARLPMGDQRATRSVLPGDLAGATAVFRGRVWLYQAAGAAAACYLGFLLFELAMVFVFRSERWIAKGLTGGLHHVFVSGSLAAAASALLVPFGFRLGAALHGRKVEPAVSGLHPRFAGVLAIGGTIGVWGYGLLARFLRS